jgi:hypothetical protein
MLPGPTNSLKGKKHVELAIQLGLSEKEATKLQESARWHDDLLEVVVVVVAIP